MHIPPAAPKPWGFLGIEPYLARTSPVFSEWDPTRGFPAGKFKSAVLILL
jgi:hypothetical protein